MGEWEEEEEEEEEEENVPGPPGLGEGLIDDLWEGAKQAVVLGFDL